MNLTAEQWRELDEAMEGTRADVEAWAERVYRAEAVAVHNAALEDAAVRVEAEARTVGVKGLLAAVTTGYIASIRSMKVTQ